MIKLFISKALGFAGLNKVSLIIVGTLLSSTAAAGYLLLDAREQVGTQKAVAAQWEAATGHWAKAYELQQTKYEALQQKMVRRDIAYNDISQEITLLKTKLGELTDESGCLDTDLGDDFWLLLKGGGPRASPSRVHGDQ